MTAYLAAALPLVALAVAVRRWRRTPEPVPAPEPSPEAVAARFAADLEVHDEAEHVEPGPPVRRFAAIREAGGEFALTVDGYRMSAWATPSECGADLARWVHAARRGAR